MGDLKNAVEHRRSRWEIPKSSPRQRNYIVDLMQRTGRHGITTLLLELGFPQETTLEDLNIAEASVVITYLRAELMG